MEEAQIQVIVNAAVASVEAAAAQMLEQGRLEQRVTSETALGVAVACEKESVAERLQQLQERVAVLQDRLAQQAVELAKARLDAAKESEPAPAVKQLLLMDVYIAGLEGEASAASRYLMMIENLPYHACSIGGGLFSDAVMAVRCEDVERLLKDMNSEGADDQVELAKSYDQRAAMRGKVEQRSAATKARAASGPSLI